MPQEIFLLFELLDSLLILFGLATDKLMYVVHDYTKIFLYDLNLLGLMYKGGKGNDELKIEWHIKDESHSLCFSLPL